MTFPLPRDERGRLVVEMVQSDRSYDRGEAVRWDDVSKQVKDALAERGIDMGREYVITFRNGPFSDGDEIRSWMPYCGTGDHMHGHATVPDSALIDPAHLLKAEPVVNDVWHGLIARAAPAEGGWATRGQRPLGE